MESSYDEGTIGVMEMLRHLLTQYDALEGQLAALEERKGRIREQIKALVERQGEKPVKVAGWELVVQRAYERRYTDPKTLARLAVDLQESHPEIAHRLNEAVKVSTVAERLTMTRQKTERTDGNEIPF